MPYADPAKRRAWCAANPDKVRAAHARYESTAKGMLRQARKEAKRRKG